jgi:hypothetical protein
MQKLESSGHLVDDLARVVLFLEQVEKLECSSHLSGEVVDSLLLLD